MAGLLYKDFVALKGKMYVTGALILLALFFGLRLLCTDDAGDFLLISLGMTIPVFAFMGILYQTEISLMETDEGKKQKQYFLSLPVTGKQYVASKYLFILLAFYAVLSWGLLVGYICIINCQTEEMQKMLSTFMGVLPALACGFLVVPTIELPFFIIYGSKRGKRIKTGFLMLFFLAMVVFLLFGDLTILDRISLAAVLAYLEEHPDTFLILQVVAPYASFALYYLSYRISCAQFVRREWEDD